MTEAEFINSTDCRFPYGDNFAARDLISKSCGISPNAAFAVADELARPPRGAKTSVSKRLALLGHLRGSLKHPLAGTVLALAERMIKGEKATVKEAMAIMERISTFPGEYAALGLAYMSCDDRQGLADRFYNEIIERWKAV